MAMRNINHFGMLHTKEVDIFERTFISKYIDIEFYELLCSLGGKVVDKYYLKEVVENFKSKYSIENVDEFIQVFSDDIENRNANDLRTVLFYVLSTNTKNIFKEGQGFTYLVDKRNYKTLEVNVRQAVKRESIETFYGALLNRVEKEFDYKIVSMLLQCPNIYFNDINKYMVGARLFKTLLEGMENSTIPFEEFIYCCYSCIEYINYVYERTSIENPQIKDSFEPIKKKAFDVIKDHMGKIDIEVYKSKNPLVYFMLISLIEEVGEIPSNAKNYEVISKILALISIEIDDEESKILYDELNISKEIAMCIKFLYISVKNEQSNYVEYMKLRDEIEYLYKIPSENKVVCDKSTIVEEVYAEETIEEGVIKEEVLEEEIIEETLTVSSVEESNSISYIEPSIEGEVSVVEDEIVEEIDNLPEVNKEESIKEVIEEDAKISNDIQESSNEVNEPIPSVAQNNLYEVLLAMQKAQENINNVNDGCDSEETVELPTGAYVEECTQDSFTFTWI